jgi:two-component system, sensor histidine kinase YesM
MMGKSLSGKLLVSFFIVIVISAASVGFFSYWQSSRALDREMERYINQMIETASYQSDAYLQSYERISEQILVNDDVKKFLEIDPSDSYAYYQYSDIIQKYVIRPISTDMIRAIYIIGYHGRSVLYEGQGMTYRPYWPERMDELKMLAPESGQIRFLTDGMRISPEKGSITLLRKIRGYSSYYEPKGLLAIELKADVLENIWRHVGLGDKGYFMIVDPTGKLAYHPDHGRIGTEIEESLRSKLFETEDTTIFEKLDGGPSMLVSRLSEYSGWRLVLSMPVEELRGPISTIRMTTILVGAVTMIIALGIAIRFGQSIVGPIRLLKEGMRQTERGNWSTITNVERDDEVGGLIHSYNMMVFRLQEMIAMVYEAELESRRTALELQESMLERQKAEFQALQLQINPHFLYNTLETINCYAIVQDSGEINEIVEAMAFMLRYSIQTNLEEITIANELNHVRNYLIILNHRFERPLELDVAVPPKLLLEKTVRLTLQPLVENALQHAFPQGLEEHHTIRIDARTEGNELLIIVEDNGAGMTSEQLEKLRGKLKENRLAQREGDLVYHRGGIGLMNVHRRIQLVFGEHYGLSVDSQPQKGTSVTLRMPRSDKPSKYVKNQDNLGEEFI